MSQPSIHGIQPRIEEKRVMDHSVMETLKYNEAGLVPAIAQQYDSGEVLMLAWMDRQAVTETLATKRVCYWSRSRKQLWRKGETSGNIQKLVEFRFDCDKDCVLLLVDQTGVACHTGRPNCFYNLVRNGEVIDAERSSLM